MNKTKKIVVIVSIVLSLLIVVGAIALAASRKSDKTSTPQAAQQGEQRPVTKAELAKATGKDGNKCYVAVDGIVYEIKDFSLWQNGEHKTSNGEAYCGADMTAVIQKSPHGKRILDVLIKIGTLQK